MSCERIISYDFLLLNAVRDWREVLKGLVLHLVKLTHLFSGQDLYKKNDTTYMSLQ